MCLVSGVEYLKPTLYREFYLYTQSCLILCAELEVSKKQSEADKKKIEELTRERDLLSKVNSANFLVYFFCLKNSGCIILV